MRKKLSSYDLRPGADQIVSAIEARLLSRENGGKPLVVLMGENHYAPTHRLLHSLTVSTILSSGIASGQDLAVGFEMANDIFGHLLQPSYPPETIERVIADDPHGQKFLRYFISYGTTGCSDLSMKNLHLNLYFNNISFACNDIGEEIPETEYYSAKDHFRGSPEISSLDESSGEVDLDVSTPFTMYLRNAAIVTNATRHVERSEAKIYLQHCGKAHMFGNRKEGIPYSTSLAAQFQNAGFDVLPVFILEKRYGLDIVPRDAASLDQSVIINNLCAYQPGNPEQEQEMIDCVQKMTGSDLPLWDLDQTCRSIRQGWKAEINSILQPA